MELFLAVVGMASGVLAGILFALHDKEKADVFHTAGAYLILGTLAFSVWEAIQELNHWSSPGNVHLRFDRDGTFHAVKPPPPPLGKEIKHAFAHFGVEWVRDLLVIGAAFVITSLIARVIRRQPRQT